MDQQCFTMGTDPRGKTFGDMWDALDHDQNRGLSPAEFQKFYKMMNLDGNRMVSRDEVGAWFKRNEYVMCRPWRLDVINILKERKRGYLNDFWGSFYLAQKEKGFVTKYEFGPTVVNMCE